MNAYFFAAHKSHSRHPKNHLLGQLVAVETEDGRLDDEELLSFCRLLLIAGNETTTGLITASARIFHEEPQTLAQLTQSPGAQRRFRRGGATLLFAVFGYRQACH